MYRDVISFLFFLLLLVPVSAGVVTYLPSSSTYPTPLVNDYVNGPEGEVVFATSSGLVFYNGNWTTYHAPPLYAENTLLSDAILSVAYGPDGHLWIGTPAGLQRMNEQSFEMMAGQEQLKNPAVIHLQRWDDALWIETCNAGMHRLENGSWTWFKPFRNGPGCYALNDLALDPAGEMLYCISSADGIWAIGKNWSAGFHQVLSGDRPMIGFTGATTDPFGGIYLFNRSCVCHLDGKGLTTVIGAPDDLGTFVGEINDICPESDGSLWFATDRGLYRWKDGSVLDHIYRAHGIWSNIIKTVFVDCTGRCWFTTPTGIGYYYPDNATDERIHFLYGGSSGVLSEGILRGSEGNFSVS